MIRSKTLFIVGAGASCEVGLPAGNELKLKIARHLDIRFEDGFRQDSGSFKIVEALKEHLRRQGFPQDINPYLASAWRIRDAAPQAISIDNFLDGHQGDKQIELCGKLGITQAILEAEKSSKLYVDFRNRSHFEFRALAETWYTSFFQLLTESVPKANIASLFENTSFIVFNYDRCIEHFLAISLQNYYGISDTEAQEITKKLAILHPYGLVGNLPWQREAIPFGAEVAPHLMLTISSQIKTFTERVTDEAALAAIRQQVQEAETIVFLGFAFHELNMQLLKPETTSRAKRVFATAWGISPSDCAVVSNDILAMLGRPSKETNIEVPGPLKCVGLFNEYWRALSRA